MRRILMTVLAVLLFFAADALAATDEVPVKEIIALDDTVKIEIGEEFSLSYKVVPPDADDKRVTFESLDKNIASVDSRGTVLGRRTGSTRIKLISADGKKYAFVRVRVVGTDYDDEYNSKLKNIAITLDDEVVNKPIEVMATQIISLSAKSFPKGVSSSVRWRSDDKDIATVDEDGTVTAVKEGTCKITATSRVNTFKTDTVILNVTKFVMYPEKLTVTAPVDSVFETGNTIPLSCSFYPENTNQFGLYWTADGAIIDQSGRLTITDRGRVTVRVYSQNRRIFAEYEIDAKYSKDSFKEVKTLSNLSKTKSVRLKFDKPADAQSARDNIFANKSADANGEDIPINIVVNENIVTVTPTGEWTDGCGIFIKPGLCAADGEKTGQGVKVLISLRRSNK